MEMVAHCAKNSVNENCLKDCGVIFDLVDIHSPREYNFASDDIDIDCRINFKELKKAYNELKIAYDTTDISSAINAFINANYDIS